MHFNIVLLAFIYSFLALALGVIAQTHPSNLNASVQIFSTDECCGSWIQWNGLAENKCLRFNANRDGFSIIVRGLWNDDTANPTGFGYGVVYKYADGQLCKAPAFEVRTPRCTKVNVPGGVESFSWVKQTYEIPGFGRGRAKEAMKLLGISGDREANGAVSVSMKGSQAEDCQGPESFGYVDPRNGLRKAIDLNGSVDLANRLTELYGQRDFDALQTFGTL
ncbi:hypothetical protein NMY22_g3007 [Coprinellus aureogranulatus]|nr:hypothetical protein NMY22_g3007 [Coprinellus aureogranulatus]